MRRVHLRCAFVVSAVMFLAACGAAVEAVASPFYITPVHLVEQADEILVVKLAATDKPLTLRAEPQRTLKPKAAERKAPIALDLSATGHKAHAEAVLAMLKEHAGEPALLFARNAGKDDPEEYLETLPVLVHFAGRWLAFHRGDDGRIEMDRIDSRLEGTWAGGTDMLTRAVEYILADPDACVPVGAGVSWGRQANEAKIDGKVNAVAPIDLDNGLKQSLFVAADTGDRLYHFDPRAGKLADVTARHKLTSRSRLFAWADFNRDGRLDLASWDGKALTLHLRRADGTFKGAQAISPTGLRGNLLGLSAIATGKEGRAGLLASTSGGPAVLVPTPDGKWQVQRIENAVASTRSAAELEGPGACLVADFDGDAVPDIIQPFANGGLFYKGRAVGRFARPVPCAVALCKGRSSAFTGDYDADGLLDVFVVGGEISKLWQNRGGGRFVESLNLSGEIAYISKPGAVCGQTCDFNNDGRQDVLIVYGDMHPQLFFNRGFRSFWHAHEVDLTEQGFLADEPGGCRAGCVADLNGDGAQDMAIVLNTGQLWVFYREVFQDDPALSVRVRLSRGSGSAGPLTVVGYGPNKRCLGAWNVTAGSPAFMGLLEAGPCVLTWRWPGGRAQRQKRVLEDKPVRFVIPPGKP